MQDYIPKFITEFSNKIKENHLPGKRTKEPERREMMARWPQMYQVRML